MGLGSGLEGGLSSPALVGLLESGGDHARNSGLSQQMAFLVVFNLAAPAGVAQQAEVVLHQDKR